MLVRARISAPWSPRLAQNGDDVGALAALADADDQGVAEAGRPVVDAEEAGGGQGDLQAVDGAKKVLGVAGGVVAGAAGGDHGVGDAASLDIGDQVADVILFFFEQRGHGLGLFVDFLVEMGVFEHVGSS